MTPDTALFEPDRPSSVEMLADHDAAAGVAASAGSRRDVDDQAAKTNGIIIVHRGLVGGGNEEIALSGADFPEGRALKLRTFSEAGIESVKIIGLKPHVGGVDLGDVGESHLGDLGVSCGLFILSYYALIAGWTFGYIFKTLLGNTVSFQQFAGNAPLNALLYLAFILMTIGVVYGGVQGGIERWSKILMPILPLILLFIIIYSLPLPGSMAGLRFYLRPDFAGVTGNTVLIALGQAFFANSLGMGAMVTYGSYLDKKQNIISSGIGVVSFGILISFLAGLAIFPAVFAMGKSPAAGPELVFVVLPEIFRMMPGGILVGTLFFILLSIAALTSTISLLEVPVAFLIDEKNVRRKVATWLVGGTTVLFGIPSALSFGASDFFTSLPIFGGISFFGMMDYIFGNIALPLGGVMFAFLVGWRWGIPEAVKEICLGNEKFLGIQSKVWAVLLKYFCPVVILLVLLRSSGLLGLLGL